MTGITHACHNKHQFNGNISHKPLLAGAQFVLLMLMKITHRTFILSSSTTAQFLMEKTLLPLWEHYPKTVCATLCTDLLSGTTMQRLKFYQLNSWSNRTDL